MEVTLKKWGNSPALRVPSAIMKALGLELDQVVDMREEEGRIVIEPVQEPVVSLDDLVAGITADNIHDEIDFGKPLGQEVDL